MGFRDQGIFLCAKKCCYCIDLGVGLIVMGVITTLFLIAVMIPLLYVRKAGDVLELVAADISVTFPSASGLLAVIIIFFVVMWLLGAPTVCLKRKYTPAQILLVIYKVCLIGIIIAFSIVMFTFVGQINTFVTSVCDKISNTNCTNPISTDVDFCNDFKSQQQDMTDACNSISGNVIKYVKIAANTLLGIAIFFMVMLFFIAWHFRVEIRKEQMQQNEMGGAGAGTNAEKGDDNNNIVAQPVQASPETEPLAVPQSE